MNIVQQRMTIIFNEWAARYAANLDQFGDILGADGKPVTDYGQRCAHYFETIAHELDAAGKLPLANARGELPAPTTKRGTI